MMNFNKSIYFIELIRNGFAPVEVLHEMSYIKVFSLFFT